MAAKTVTEDRSMAGDMDLVTQVEKELGDQLNKARTDYAECNSGLQQLDAKRSELLARRSELKANHVARLIEHGKGVEGAAKRRKQAEMQLADAEDEIVAVDAAIAFEAERLTGLTANLNAMESRLSEAHRHQLQQNTAKALQAKKEEFITHIIRGCIIAGELTELSDRLVALDGRALLDQVLEDLLMRTNRTLLIDKYKFTPVRSSLNLSQRSFEVSALLPPPEPPTPEAGA